ncbi:MAG: CopG family transcriptional regulator [Aquabacterium sp.]|nr:CopG family transcriptional regulator [Aquabacterium sp.]
MERPRGWVIKQALAAYVDREAERYRMTMAALGDVDAKNGLSHQEVTAWAASLSSGNSGQLPDLVCCEPASCSQSCSEADSWA